MSIKDDKTRLRHMLEAAQKAVDFVDNKTFQDLENDEILVLALVKLIEIVGEAASRVSKDYQANNPQINFVVSHDWNAKSFSSCLFRY